MNTEYSFSPIYDKFLFGAAYYAEYMPYDRIDTDFSLMKKSGINVIRIAESTWSTHEPREGVFDFSALTAMLDCAVKYDLKVIVGTPTYAIPSWLYHKHPDVLAVTKDGPLLYGSRQLTDLTNKHYLFYAERVTRKMMEICRDSKAVIGYQIDNETRIAGAAGPDIQKKFVEYLKELYPDINDLNREFGLDYWSNRVDSWEDFPDIRGTINGSLSAEYKKFLRKCITDFHKWLADIVREYTFPGQFVTHNFDYEWRNYSHGMLPLVNQPESAASFDISGCDIYYRSQDDFDGSDISFCCAIARSLKKSPFLVLETHAQGLKARLPYPGQMLQAMYSFVSGGATGILYWNWHSIHNSFESYWKGILSHDLLPNRIYDELSSSYTEFTKTVPSSLLAGHGLMPINDVAIMLDRCSCVGLEEFPFDDTDHTDYNDVVRTYFDGCYELGIHCDVIYPGDDPDRYRLIIIPAMYSVSDETVRSLRSYIENGGHVLMSFKSLFADRNLKIYHDAQPHGITDICGFTYDEFTVPGRAKILFDNGYTATPKYWIELLRTNSETAKVWGRYEHKYWEKYAAVIHQPIGKGSLTYVGAFLEKDDLKPIISKLADTISLDIPGARYPVVARKVSDSNGEKYMFISNYSDSEADFIDENICPGTIHLSDWDTKIIKI